MDVNQFGKTSKLSITVQNRQSADGHPRTIVSDCFFTAPFKVMKPFPRADGGLMIYQQTASAGVMAGDRQEFNFLVEDSACLEIVSQSFDKIFKMDDGKAARTIHAEVAHNGILIYAPLPCIPFGGSNFSSYTKIRLADSSAKLLYEDCICCGRKGHGELFAYKEYHNSIEIERQGKLIYRENTLFTGSDCGSFPENELFMKNNVMYGDYSHLGQLLIFGYGIPADDISFHLGLPDKFLYTPDTMPAEEPSHPLLAGVTTTESNDIIVRVLADSAEEIQNFFTPVKKHLAELH
ncbi:MAG: urease accessory protein UreD [Treponema sp.]